MQYWYREDLPYGYVSNNDFVKNFKTSSFGKKLDQELSKPADKTELQKSALSFSTYSLNRLDLFRACMSREWLLMKRNSFVYLFKSAQVVFSNYSCTYV